MPASAMPCAGQIVAEQVRSRRSRYAQSCAVVLVQPRIVQAIPVWACTVGASLSRRRKSAVAGSVPRRRSVFASFRGFSTVNTAHLLQVPQSDAPTSFAPSDNQTPSAPGESRYATLRDAVFTRSYPSQPRLAEIGRAHV